MSQLGLGMDYDDEPRARRRRSSGPLAVIIAVLMLGGVALAGYLGIRALTGGGSADDYAGSGTGSVTVVVEKGDSLTAIGRTLAAAGVVASSDAFVSAAAANPKAESITPGAYALKEGMSGESAVALLLDPASRVVEKVVIPEGLRVSEIIPVITKATGLTEDEVKDSLSRAGKLGLPAYAEGEVEGFLFPATYEFQPGASADQVVKAMLTRFNQAADAVDLEAAAKKRGITPKDAVIMASLVQGESAPEDYDKVARVIYNRIDDDMRLQFDSTVNYALGTSEIQLSKDQLATDSPYNTYRYKGLPPGPIGSPGEQALEAVLAPAKGTWLYFVATDPANGVTEFATSYDDFLVLKRKFQANAG
ncbi:MAG: endolytic transglycosylase MltG [Actinobacteria bacterium]|jgi:UPF0755 protein|nr:endolytic transglycosylase MltG [Actinomycetota bacterium]